MKIVKGNFKIIFSILISGIMCLTLLTINVSTATASDGWKTYIESKMWAGNAAGVDVVKGEESATVISVTSSKTTVIKVTTEEWKNEDGQSSYDYYILNAIKAGKSKITVNYITPDGNSGTIEKTVTVKKYPKEFKSLKVNGKKVNTNKNKFYLNRKCSKSKVSVKAALKKGWKTAGLSAYIYKKNWENEKKVKFTKKMLKKGTKMKFPKNYEYMTVFINLKKGNSYIYYIIDFHR